MSAPYVPGSVHELVGYLASIVKHAAADYPDDEAFARGVAVYKAYEAAKALPTNPDRRCRTCGATSGLRLLIGNPLIIAPREWECTDGCAS